MVFFHQVVLYNDIHLFVNITEPEMYANPFQIKLKKQF
jgi:hypothetical protein